MTFKTILEAIAYNADMNPDKTCLVEAQSGRTLTYSQFWQSIIISAEKLKSLGLKKDENVIVHIGSFLETFIARFGINLAGGVYCPVDRSVKEYRMFEMIEHLQSNFIISTEKPDFKGQWIDLSTLCCFSYENNCVNNFSFPNPDDLCAILYTTGTTGKAKGVMISYNAFMMQSLGYCDVLEIKSDTVFLWANPLDRIVSEAYTASVIIAGGTSVHNEGMVFVNDFFDAVGKYKVSLIFLDPSSLSILLKVPSDNFEKYKRQLKTVFFGGSFMSEKYKKQIQELLPLTKLFLAYGSTEASAAVTIYEFSRYTDKTNCVGKPHSFVKIYILDENGDVIHNSSKTNTGNVACESPALMIGYWKDETLTNSVLKNGQIVLADIGYIDEEGFLYLVGRKDDVIITGGHKVAPYEIEDIAMQIPGVLECVCIGIPNNILGSVPKLFVVMKDNEEFSANNIAQQLEERLEKYKLPRIIEKVDRLPRVGETQKIDRKSLKQL